MHACMHACMRLFGARSKEEEHAADAGGEDEDNFGEISNILIYIYIMYIVLYITYYIYYIYNVYYIYIYIYYIYIYMCVYRDTRSADRSVKREFIIDEV